MPAATKRMKVWTDKVPPGKQFPLDDALKLVKELDREVQRVGRCGRQSRYRRF